MQPAFDQPYEQITPDNSMMILIDHQQGLMLTAQSIWLEQLKRNVLGLAGLAKAFNLPTLITSGNLHGWQGPLIPEIQQIVPEADYIRRSKHNCMQDDNVRGWAEQTGRKKIIFAGITSDACVALSTIGAVGLGYEAYCVHDCCSSWDQTAELAAMMRMTQGGVIMTNWKSVGTELQGDWGQHEDTARALMSDFEEFNAANAGMSQTITSAGGTVSS